jgi:hypothetical protein
MIRAANKHNKKPEEQNVTAKNFKTSISLKSNIYGL